MGLNDESKRKLKSVESMIYAGLVDEKAFRDLMKKTNGKDFDTSMVLFDAYASAHTKYDSFLEKKVIQEQKYNLLNVKGTEKERIDEFLSQKMDKHFSEKEFMEGFLAREVGEKTKQRDLQIKAISKEKIKKERAEALGMKWEGIKRAVGLSR